MHELSQLLTPNRKPQTAVCDPCNFTECPFYAFCKSQRDGFSTRCECSDLCPASFSPVCGSNSRTYWNECYLRREACLTKQNTTLSSHLPCYTTPCFHITCPFYGICRLSEGGTPYCACSNSCVEIYRPVCGSDGRSYFNKCFLRKTSCRLQKSISVEYTGLCSKSVSFVPTFLLCFFVGFYFAAIMKEVYGRRQHH
ncbi:tomoregulin-1-like [Montipora capricornis]|uniref:tomoregulin-1-like n=1 Tax=Montipora capricornis TaxID=246305 RepID=UPI0035F14867